MAQITAELALQITQLQAGLEAARREIRGFRQNAEREGAGMGDSLFGKLKGAGALLGAAGAAFGGGAAFKEILGHYDDIADTALKLNESTETVQRVGGVSELSGLSVEGLAGSVLKLEKALGDVENTKAREALERYGLTAEQLIGLPLDQKILLISEAFQKARTDGTGYNDLMTLLGKSAGDLIPLLSQTKESLEEAFAGIAVVSDADVQRLAELNDQFDKMLMTTKALAAQQTSAVLGTVKFAVDWLTNGEQAFEDLGEEQMRRDAVAKRRVDSKKAQAENTQLLQDQAQAEKDAKEQAKQDAKSGKAGGELEKLRIDALPEEERLQALRGQVQALLDKAGMADEGELADWANSFNDDIFAPSPEALEVAVGLLKEVRDLNKEIAGIEDKQKSATDAKNKELETLRDATEKGGIKLLSPKEQAEAMRAQLAESLGLEVTSGAVVSQGLAKLQQEADDARASGDVDAEKSALERLKNAQEQAGELAGLGSGSKDAALAGETTGVLGMLLGKGGRDLVVDETKANGATLKSIERILGNMDRWQRQGGFADVDEFGFNMGGN